MDFNPQFLEILDRYQHIIWDWNGTLLDDVDAVMITLNDLLKQHHLPATTKDDYRRDFCFPVKNYYKILGFDFEQTSYDLLADQFINLYNRDLVWAKLYKGMPSLLEQLIGKGKTLSVLSAAQQQHLEGLLTQYQLRPFFSNIYGLENYHAQGKIQRGKELISAAQFPPQKTIMVGDTDHDFEVASKIGIACILLADGHQTYQRLSKICPLTFQSRYQ